MAEDHPPARRPAPRGAPASPEPPGSPEPPESPGPAGPPGPGTAAVVLRDVSKHYGLGQDRAVPAADHVSLRIEPGAFVALTGASGSGKSTLLQLIGAIDRPDSGTIISGGAEVTALRGGALAAYRRTVGFIFQRYNLLPALTALDNVIAPVLPYRTTWNKRERGRELLAAVGLAGRERSLPGRLSGGEQQRVAIARSLINDPALLLADEATGNLDSQNAADILNLITALRAERPMTIVIATHDPQIAARCDRLIRLRDGAVIDDVDLAEGYPADQTLRRLSQLG
jgi:putative ABC transport system ATP-binding protein